MTIPATPKAPLGLIEIPGMRGKITIHFDLSKGQVMTDFGGSDLRQSVQILLMAIQGAVAEWIKIDARIVRPAMAGGGSNSGNPEGPKNDGPKNDDHHD